MRRDLHPVTLAAADEVRPVLFGDGLELSRRQAMVQLLALSKPPAPSTPAASRPAWWSRLTRAMRGARVRHPATQPPG